MKNQIILKGILCQPLEGRISGGEIKIVKGSIMVKDSDDTYYFKFYAFNEVAELMQNNLFVGNVLTIYGKLTQYTYKNKEDKSINLTEICVDSFEKNISLKKKNKKEHVMRDIEGIKQ